MKLEKIKLHMLLRVKKSLDIPEWVGKSGIVESIEPSGFVTLRFNGRGTYMFLPKSLKR